MIGIIFGTNPTSMRKRLALGAATLIILAVISSSAWAQIISDPFGIVSIGTAPTDNPNADVAISNGGTANGVFVAGSTTGQATGLAAISGEGTATGGYVASGTNNANGSALAVGVAGRTCSQTAAIGVAGPANTSGCPYTGPAGVSGINDASGSAVAVSGTGNASDASLLSASVTQTRVSAGGNVVMDNTGDAVIPNATQALDALYVPPAAGLQRKLAAFADLQPGVQYNLAAGVASSAVSPDVRCPSQPCQGLPPTSGAVTQPLTSQTKKYTCGPAASRLVLWQMTGADPGESSLESAEHTTPHDGTYHLSIPPVLNARQSIDTFQFVRPGDATSFMSYLTTDVWSMNHSLIDNVQAGLQAFWHGHKAWHYDVAYGYSHSGGGAVKIAEEWDPTRFTISLSSYGGVNPYGYHTDTLANVWSAVQASISHGIIW